MEDDLGIGRFFSQYLLQWLTCYNLKINVSPHKLNIYAETVYPLLLGQGDYLEKEKIWS